MIMWNQPPHFLESLYCSSTHVSTWWFTWLVRTRIPIFDGKFLYSRTPAGKESTQTRKASGMSPDQQWETPTDWWYPNIAYQGCEQCNVCNTLVYYSLYWWCRSLSYTLKDMGSLLSGWLRHILFRCVGFAENTSRYIWERCSFVFIPAVIIMSVVFVDRLLKGNMEDCLAILGSTLSVGDDDRFIRQVRKLYTSNASKQTVKQFKEQYRAQTHTASWYAIIYRD